MSQPPSAGARFRLLERVTAVVLMLVLAMLAYILVTTWAVKEVQVVLVIVLLAAALVLVSVVALLHTRGS